VWILAQEGVCITLLVMEWDDGPVLHAVAEATLGSMAGQQSLKHRLVLRWAKAVSRVLYIGTIAGLLVVVGRILNASPKIWEIDKLPLKAAWVFFLGLTVAHGFSGTFLVRAIEEARHTYSKPDQFAIYDDIMAEGGLYMHIVDRRVLEPRRSIVRMGPRDPSAWVAHGGVILVIYASLPWWWQGTLRWPGLGSSIAIGCITLLLVLVNWNIGSKWAIAISLLGSSNPLAGARLKGALVIPTIVISPAPLGLYLLIAVLGGPIVTALVWLAHLLI
jgi:hypothetical protein